MVFHWSLSDSKSPPVSRTLLSILAVLNNAVLWMVSNFPPTPKFYSFGSLSRQRSMMFFHWSLSDNNSVHVSRTLPIILANFNYALVWMLSTCALISKFISPFTNTLGIVPSVQTTIGITITFMFHIFFSSLQGPDIYLSSLCLILQ